MRHLSNRAKGCIPVQWNFLLLPTVGQWIRRVNDIWHMEDLTASQHKQKAHFRDVIIPGGCMSFLTMLERRKPKLLSSVICHSAAAACQVMCSCCPFLWHCGPAVSSGILQPTKSGFKLEAQQWRVLNVDCIGLFPALIGCPQFHPSLSDWHPLWEFSRPEVGKTSPYFKAGLVSHQVGETLSWVNKQIEGEVRVHLIFHTNQNPGL